MGRVFVLVGPPGSGKGTQAELLRERFGLIHFDMGGELRREMASGSELGETIAGYVNQGKLVPLPIIAQIVGKFLSQNQQSDILFDGFPRSLEQAEVLDRAIEETDSLELRAVFNFVIPKEMLLERVVYRRLCPQCGAVYNLRTNPPKEDELCDRCGAKLIQRSDDREEVFLERYQTQYEGFVVPVINHYRKMGKVVDVDATGSVEEIFAQLEESFAQG